MPHQPRAPGADGQADGDLLAAAGGPSQEEVGQVGAGDQQHHPHHGHQERRHGDEGSVHHGVDPDVVRGSQHELAIGVGRWVSSGQLLGEHVRRRLRFHHADSRSQPPFHPGGPRSAIR